MRDNPSDDPSQRRNPANPSRRVTKALRDALDSAVSPAEVQPWVDRLNEIAFEGEDRESIKAIELLMNRYFGKPAQQIEIADDGPRRITLSFVPPKVLAGLMQ